jgi:plastocyanin
MNVQLAETVECTFTNTADGTLIIRKETFPDGADQGFTFTGEAAGTIRDFSTFAEEIVVSGLPGTYTSAESVPEGWAITGISCTGQVQSGVTIGDNDVSVDLVAGETVICTFENSAQGSITIEKFTQGGLGAFQFNSDLGSFPLDTLTNGNPDAVTFSSLASGVYMFSEVVPSNWTLSDIQCSGATNSIITIGGAGDFDPGDQGVTIELNDGESIVCSFVNDADGSITVTKLTDPAGSAQSFDFTGAITASLTDGQSSDPIMVPPGNYDVSETLVAGWNLTDISCNDDDSTGNANTASFVVAPGEVVNCTFTNTIQRGNIVVVKQTDPDGSTEDFGFTSNYGGPFSLTDGQQNDSGPLLPSSEAGTYSVAEDAEAGWDLTSSVCTGDGNTPAAITLLPGETVTCVFNNTQRGNIVVVKHTDPDGSTEDFGFVTNYGDVFVLSDGEQNDSGPLLPSSVAGTYTVVEDDEAGWDLTSAVCTGVDNTPASITLMPGETVTCVFTNTQRGSVTIVKQASSDGTFQFGFSGPEFGAALIDITTSNGVGEESFIGLQPGSYSVNELDPAPFVLISATCDNGDQPESLTLEAGEDITCTFINDLPIAVPVNSTWALLLLTLMMLATGLYFRPAAMRKF